MTDMRTKKEIKAANVGNAIAVGVAGVVAGGLAVGTAVLMSDKKNQKKVGAVITEVKEKMTEYLGALESQPIVKKIV